MSVRRKADIVARMLPDSLHALGFRRGARRALPIVALAVALAACAPGLARAQAVELMPAAGWAWGGTQEFTIEPFHGTVHIEAAPEYGLSVVAYGSDYGAEVIYHAQITEVSVRVDGIGTIGSVDASIHYVLLQLMRQEAMGGVIPFVSVGFGATGLYAAGESEWQFGFSAGGGVRKRFGNGGSLRLSVRLLVPLEVVDNGFSFGAAGSGLGIGGPNALYQGDVSLGYSFPIWTLP